MTPQQMTDAEFGRLMREHWRKRACGFWRCPRVAVALIVVDHMALCETHLDEWQATNERETPVSLLATEEAAS